LQNWSKCNVCLLDFRFESQSRFWASTQLKGEIEDARALAVASGLVRASDLPPGCARLKQPRQLPQLPEEWQISWTDTPMRHKQTGLIRWVYQG